MNAAPPIVVWGTAPNSAKTHVCMALLRLLARRGVPAVPFKAISVLEPGQWHRNRSECPIPHHVAAAQSVWSRWMSPVVVSRTDVTGPRRGTLYIHGDSCGEVPLLTEDTLDGADLPEELRARVRDAITTALIALTAGDAALVVEGAGSPVDAGDDLANQFVVSLLPDARIIISAYCWDGGSAASLIGTLTCLPERFRRAVVGFVMNRPATDAASRRWAALVTEKTGVPLLALVGDMFRVISGAQINASIDPADPWADAFAAGADLALLFRSQGVGG